VTAGAVWLAIVREGRGPPRRPGQLRLLAHLRAQKGAGVAAACAAAGVRLRSVPPYAPDCSPREACGAKGKASRRAMAARTLAAWEQALAAARAALTSPEAPGWFGHAGYGVASNCTLL
jgi:hypothetical protein